MRYIIFYDKIHLKPFYALHLNFYVFFKIFLRLFYSKRIQNISLGTRNWNRFSYLGNNLTIKYFFLKNNFNVSIELLFVLNFKKTHEFEKRIFLNEYFVSWKCKFSKFKKKSLRCFKILSNLQSIQKSNCIVMHIT